MLPGGSRAIKFGVGLDFLAKARWFSSCIVAIVIVPAANVNAKAMAIMASISLFNYCHLTIRTIKGLVSCQKQNPK
jgi:hypothetical protein